MLGNEVHTHARMQTPAQAGEGISAAPPCISSDFVSVFLATN